MIEELDLIQGNSADVGEFFQTERHGQVVGVAMIARISLNEFAADSDINGFLARGEGDEAQPGGEGDGQGAWDHEA